MIAGLKIELLQNSFIMSTANTGPKVSVVIPVFNVEEYLEEAVDSILNQTLAPFEVIIVNDGSTDQSDEIVDSRYKQDHRVKIVHTKNRGPGPAKNIATAMAKGDFIYYFDADDVVEKDLLADFADEYIKDPSLDLYGFSGKSISNLAHPTVLEYYGRGFSGSFSSGKAAFNKLKERSVFFHTTWLYIVRRTLLLDNQLAFKSILYEDLEFTPRLYFVAGRTVINDQLYYNRRLRYGSIMHTKPTMRNLEGFLESVKALNALFLLETNKTTKKLLRRYIISYSIKLLEDQNKFNIPVPQADLNYLKKLAVSYYSATLSLALLPSKLFRPKLFWIVGFVIKVLKVPKKIRKRFFLYFGKRNYRC